MDTGVAQNPVDIEEYKRELAERIGQGRKLMTVVTEKARRNPKKIVFPEGSSSRILRADPHGAVQAGARVATPPLT